MLCLPRMVKTLELDHSAAGKGGLHPRAFKFESMIVPVWFFAHCFTVVRCVLAAVLPLSRLLRGRGCGIEGCGLRSPVIGSHRAMNEHNDSRLENERS